MSEASLKPVIDELETLFSKFNERFFENKLESPVITVSPDHTRGAMAGVPVGRLGRTEPRKAGSMKSTFALNI